jgi:hypothetical protein
VEDLVAHEGGERGAVQPVQADGAVRRRSGRRRRRRRIRSAPRAGVPAAGDQRGGRQGGEEATAIEARGCDAGVLSPVAPSLAKRHATC